MALAGKDGLRGAAFLAAHAQHQAAPGHGTAQSRARLQSAQAVKDQIAHRGTVPRTGKAAGTGPAQQRLFGGIATKNAVKNGDGRFDAGSWGHVACAPGATDCGSPARKARRPALSILRPIRAAARAAAKATARPSAHRAPQPGRRSSGHPSPPAASAPRPAPQAIRAARSPDCPVVRPAA